MKKQEVFNISKIIKDLNKKLAKEYLEEINTTFTKLGIQIINIDGTYKSVSEILNELRLKWDQVNCDEIEEQTR